MKRSEFKKILKECLIEILTEEPAIKKKLQEHVVAPKPPLADKEKIRQLAKSMTNAEQLQETMMLEKINNIALDMSGGNTKHAELMKEIFADTALNTIPQQHEVAPGVVDDEGVDLDSLGATNIDHWAQIAFSVKK